MLVKKIMYGAIGLLVVLLFMFLEISFNFIKSDSFALISAAMYTKVMIGIVGLLGAGLLIESDKYKEFGYLYIFNKNKIYIINY